VSKVVAVDVGGTFTDLVVLDTLTGAVGHTKTETTPDAPAEGVLRAGEKAGISLRDTSIFFHGTTLGINTVLERKGARTGLITTKGFRDELEIARLLWPMYRLHWEPPDPLVPRFLRREVSERVRADGTVIQELDEAEVREVIEKLIAERVESIAVCFLHAYAFPEHERRVGEIIEADYPEVDYTLSHRVTQEYREFERTSTTVTDAMIKPTMARYIESLEARLHERGFAGELLITRCDGGVMSAGEAAQRSIRSLISGPASGIMGAAALGRWLGAQNIIVVDMGGTSFDAALIIDGEPILRSVAQVQGVTLLMPTVELATLGAGGGSIARLDAGGTLEIGPESAGADPGPICYGKGGTEPTFTDAALVSGLLDPAYFLGGGITLDGEAARHAIEERIAKPLGLSTADAASGIVTLTEAKMATLIEEITIGKGYDPRDFTLLAYGGGGPLVASALASRLEIGEVVVPRSPGTFSAQAMLMLDIVHDFAQTSVSKLDGFDRGRLMEIFAELEANASRTLEREGVPQNKREILRSVDMRYENQEHTLSIPLAVCSLETLSLEQVREYFDERHTLTYGYSTAEPVELVVYRVRAVGSLDKPRRPSLESGSSSSDHALKGRRSACHRESGGEFHWAIYDRELLKAGNSIAGPAIVEEPTATTVVAPSQKLTVDQFGNLVIRCA
jgi:N-methylhydantoinase A